MSNLLTAAEIAGMRADLEGLALPDSANILSGTSTPDGQGGFIVVWGTASANVACRLNYRQGVQMVAGEGLKPFSGWMLTLPQATTITSANRVEVGGNTFSITSIDAGKSWDLCRRVQVEKI